MINGIKDVFPDNVAYFESMSLEHIKSFIYQHNFQLRLKYDDEKTKVKNHFFARYN